MARDRKRAKQRKARRAQQGGAPKDAQAGGPERSEVEPGTVPGGLEHVSGEVDQFEAALVAGAEGEPVTGDSTEAAGGSDHPEALTDDDFGQLEDRIDEVEKAFEDGDDREADELERELDEEASRAAPAAATAGAATKRGPARFIAFLRASWSELRRVQWPDRRQVGQATAVVLGFVVVAGIYLGIADVLANEIVDLII